MSKVYSFRLSDNNPREAQAREVIDAWAEEGYSLRHVIVEALIALNQEELGQSELDSVVEQLQDLILSLGNPKVIQTPDVTLPNTFLNAVKNSIKLGLSTE